MNGSWWWIDRWRKSTAYTDMTAEEQGLYRNLLDEVWLRPSHAIPNDPRILARVSGDVDAWGRCGEKVLRWMTLTDAGWTNATAMAVIDKSARLREVRAESGRKGFAAVIRGRQGKFTGKTGKRTGKATGTATGNTDGQTTASLNLLISDEKISRDERGGDTWLTEPLRIWKTAYGGSPKPGQFAAELSQVRDDVGQEAMCERLTHYCRFTDAQYASGSRFAAIHGDFACNGSGCKHTGGGPRVAAKTCSHCKESIRKAAPYWCRSPGEHGAIT